MSVFAFLFFSNIIVKLRSMMNFALCCVLHKQQFYVEKVESL